MCPPSVDDDTSKVTAEELSAFYKDFLDKTHEEQKSFTRYIAIIYTIFFVQHTSLHQPTTKCVLYMERSIAIA